MRWQDLRRELAAALGGNPALADERPIIHVDVDSQRLHWIDVDEENRRAMVSREAMECRLIFIKKCSLALKLSRLGAFPKRPGHRWPAVWVLISTTLMGT